MIQAAGSTLTDRGYRFLATVERHGEAPARSGRTGWYVGGTVASVALIVTVGAWLGVYERAEQGPEVSFRVVPLTSYPGEELHACFSPDGTRVAFAWDGESQNNFNIYVKEIDSDTRVQLTTDPGLDSHPAWSPDGRFIAFLRRKTIGAEPSVVVIPAIGGPDRLVAQVGVAGVMAFQRRDTYVRLLAWSPDSKHLVVVDSSSSGEPTALFLLSIETGEKQRLTSPPAGPLGDTGPAFSPDGRTLAFVRTPGLKAGDVYLLPLSEDLTPQEEPKRLTFQNWWVHSPAWTGDGREVVFSAVFGRLRRISASGSGKPQPLAATGAEIMSGAA